MRVGLHAPFLPALGGGEKVMLTLLQAALARGHEVTLLSPGPAAPDPAAWRRLSVDVAPGAFAWRRADDDATVSRASGALDLLVACTVDVPPLSRAGRSVAVVQFPSRRRTGPWRALSPRAGRHLASYDRFLVYSAWVAEQARARLGIEADVLAPPVEVPDGPPVAGRDAAVLAVGRFFRGQHDKRHDLLIDAFRALDPPAPWRLDLVGGILPGDEPHLDALRERAAGLRVAFHADAPAAVLAGLQERAALVWHAAGHGVDARRHPQRLEHFGIAVAEGMAHGAVPLAFAAGGPAEIVRHGVDGVLWRTPGELVGHTARLVGDPEGRRRMAGAAREAARRFARPAFLRRAGPLVFGDPS